MVLAEIHKAYLKGQKKVPETKIVGLDTDKADQRMTELLEHCENQQQKQEVAWPDWIWVATWGLKHERVRRCKSITLTITSWLVLKRRIGLGLKLNKKKAATAGIEMEKYVASG
jgi:hypothetical protein